MTPALRLFLLTGILGGFTTFSSYAFESFVLVRDGQMLWASINLAAKLGLRRLMERNHTAAMRRGEEGLRAILAAGYEPPHLDTEPASSA